MPVGQRELPNDFEAEQAVLGSVLISKDALAEVVGQLTSEQFYHQAHRLIYAGMMALYDMNQPVDVTTLTAYLRDMNQLDKMGSVEYLMQLSDSVPTSAHVRYYAKIIEDKRLDNFVKERYSSYYNTEIGKKILANEVGLEELFAYAENLGEVELPGSGKQEYLESVVNAILFGGEL